MKIESLKQRQADSIAALKELLALDAPDMSEVNRLNDEVKSITDRINIARSVAQFQPEPSEDEFQTEPQVKAWERQAIGAGPDLRAFAGRDNNEKAYNAYAFGQWMRATALKSASARKWCQDHGVLKAADIKAMNEGTGSAGGFAVPTIISDQFVYLREQASIMRQDARKYTMTSNALNVPVISGSVTAVWGAENTAITASDLTVASVALSAKKLTALSVMSSELNEDAVVNFASILAMDMANKLGHEEDRVCFNGTGIAGDGGITGLCQYIFGLSGTKANIASLVTAPSFTATPANLTLAIWQSLVAKLPVYAQQNAKFYMHKQIFFNYVADKLITLGGNNYSALAMGAGLQPTLFGYPVQFVQDMPSALTTASINTPIAVLADLSKAVAFGDRRELSIATSTERYFDQDSIAVRAIERVGFSGATDPGNVNAAVASQVPGSAIVLVTNATTA